MKRFSVLFMMLSLPLLSLTQLASTICLDEVKAAYQQIDPKMAMSQGTMRKVSYQHTYIMRMDPKKEEKTGKESRLYARDFYRHDSPDALVVSDGGEAFNFRKFQYVIYRTAPSLDKAGIIPKAEAALFDHATVRECHFVPAPGEDSISYKRARLTLDATGQKTYQMKEMIFITNPLDSSLVSIRVNFTDKSLYTFSFFEFNGMEDMAEMKGSTSAKDAFLKGDGDLLENYQGVQLQDYRR